MKVEEWQTGRIFQEIDSVGLRLGEVQVWEEVAQVNASVSGFACSKDCGLVH